MYWQNCSVKVYEKGQSEPKHEFGRCDGCATVPAEIELTFWGEGGKIKKS